MRRIRDSRKMKGIWLLTGIMIMILLNIIVPCIAVPLNTTTFINSSVGVIQNDESLNFTIYVYSGYDPVPSGSIKLTDLNNSQYIYGNILNGVVVIEWVPEEFTEGVHIFRAEFQGYLDYLTSSAECLVYFDEYGYDPTRETSISIDVNSSVVFKNQSLKFTVELLVLSQWYLNGGYIYVKNTNLTGSSVIHTHGPLPNYFPGTVPVVYSFTFDYQVPIFSSVGNNSFIAYYTGSSQSRTQPCSSIPLKINIKSAGYWLQQYFDQIELQREESVLKINTTVLGDYPVGLKLQSYYYIDGEKVFFTSQILTERSSTSNFSPNSSIPIGSLSIFTELIDPSTSHQYANTTKIVIILDHARIDHSENATEYRHNETIRFEVYITENDVWTHPISSCEVEFVDVSDENRSIETKNTNQNGFVIFDYTIPNNASVGNHKFKLTTHNAGTYIIDVSETFIIPIKGLIDIDITYDSGGVDRNSYTLIEVSILSGDISIDEGLVALEFGNGTAINIKECEPGLVFNYLISPFHPLGMMSYQIHFFGSSNYDETIEEFTLIIFSNPSFNSTGQNASEVIKGETLRIWGQLVDEIYQPIVFEDVHLQDTTTGTYLGVTTTNDIGIFYFDYPITESMQIGIHFIEMNFQGNIIAFLHSSINKPVISVTVRPPLSIMISSEVISNSWVIVSLSGGLSDEVILSWQKTGESEWLLLGSVFLNSTGQGEYNWTTPYYKGGFSIRAVGPFNTKYDYSTMFALPSVFIMGTGVGNVNDPYSFTIESTERYQIWIGGQIWQNWVSGGFHSYRYSFTSRGIKDIMVVSNDTYVYYNEYRHTLSVYEDVISSLNCPLEAYVNMTVNLDGIVIGEVSGPLMGFDVLLEVNGTEIEVDSTNGAGCFDFSVIFLTPGFYKVKVRIPSKAYYSESLSDSSIIFIKSIPAKIEVISPLNHTYGSIIEINIFGDANSYWYWIDPIDSGNISWSESVYRTLDEGNYTFHVYGQNSYGVITSKCTKFIVDTTVPSLALISPNNSTYTTNSLSLSYLTDEDDVVVFLDGNQILDAESGSLLPNLSDGSHNLTIIVQDEVGNVISAKAFFKIDTIPPSLTILSPFNQSYGGQVVIKLKSNGTAILYNIPSIHTFNQTYIEQISFNLTLGTYILNVYAFDDAGNFKKDSVKFSIVQTIDLLVNPDLDTIDNAGNYLIKTRLLNNPDFEEVAILLNGSSKGILEWSSLYSDYRLSFQLETPGEWQLTLYAKTTLEEYDFHYFNISWTPPTPVFDMISVSWVLSYYEVQAKVYTESLSLEAVNVSVNGVEYELEYEYFRNRWVGNLPISPQNTSLFFFAWYPWDKIPTAQMKYETHWIAPSIIKTNYFENRENFSLEVRFEKQNASIDSGSIFLIINNSTVHINVSGTLIYESLTGSYQEWIFTSPNLPREVWNFTLFVGDIYGATRSVFGVFNASDSPPFFIGEPLIKEKAKTTDTVLYRVEVAVGDDYQVDRVFLLVDGLSVQSISQNATHFIFEIYLIHGVHTLQLVAYDDIGQENKMNLESIEVSISNDEYTTISNTDSQNNSSIPPINEYNGNGSENGQTGDIIELGLAGSVFAFLIAISNFINRKRRV